MAKTARRIAFTAAAACCALTLTLCACASPKSYDDCTVVLVLPDGASCAKNVQTVSRGSDVTFSVTMPENRRILDVDYGEYTVYGGQTQTSVKRYRLTLHAVRYSAYVEVTDGVALTTAYMPNGGEGETVTVTESAAHLRPVSLNAQHAFTRDGYVQTGWNTAPDGSGKHYNFGGRLDHVQTELTLYAEWQEESDLSQFVFTLLEYSDNLALTKYTGDGGTVAVPASVNGKPVVEISSGAFAGKDIPKLVLADSLRQIEKGAFTDCEIGELVMFDSLWDVSDDSFTGCTLSRLYLNADTAPRYSGNYFDAFPDKCDRLRMLEGKRKIILSAGSSARFGYDSPAIEKHFEGYSAVNMGVYAYANMRPQLEIICHYAQAGDILVHGTEFDAIDQQFCAGDSLGYEIFAMTESNYDLLSLLDMSTYTDIFDSYYDYSYMRARMSEKSYELTIKDLDEDGNATQTATYNDYGDYVLYRKNNEELKNFGIKRAYYNAAHFPQEKIDRLNAVLGKFTEKGVDAVYTYTPRMNTSLSEDSTEESIAYLGRYLDERLTVPVIADIHESLYSPLYFYGTDNHLSTEGADIYTQKTIEYLEKYLNSKK